MLMGCCLLEESKGQGTNRHKAEGRCPQAAFRAPQAPGSSLAIELKNKTKQTLMLPLFLLLTPQHGTTNMCKQRRGSLTQ